MKKKRLFNVVGVLLVGFLMIMPSLVVSNADAAQPKPIKIGHLGEWTGPAGTTCGPIGDAVLDYFHEYVNKEKGGIPYADPKTGKILGKVKVEVLYIDGRYELPLYKSGFRKMLDKGVIAFHTTASPAAEGLKKDFRRDKTPLFMSSGNTAALWPPEWVYACRGTFADDMGFVIDWLLENWKEKRPLRVALTYADSSFGKSVLWGGPEYAKSKGVEVVAIEPIPMMPVDTTAQLLRIKKAKADWILNVLIDHQVAILLKDKQRLGITIPEFEMACTEGVIRMAGKAAEGIYMPFHSGAPQSDESYAGNKFVNELYRKYAKNRGGKQFDAMYAIGIFQAGIIEESLRLALEKVHPDKLTGTKLREYGIHRVKNITVNGINKSLGFDGGKDHRGPDYYSYFRVINGKSVFQGWRKVPTVLPPWMKK